MKAERAAIEQTLGQVHWNRRKAAQILGVSYKTLLNKIKECGISREPYRRVIRRIRALTRLPTVAPRFPRAGSLHDHVISVATPRVFPKIRQTFTLVAPTLLNCTP